MSSFAFVFGVVERLQKKAGGEAGVQTGRSVPAASLIFDVYDVLWRWIETLLCTIQCPS
jgi:hypothetical protein